MGLCPCRVGVCIKNPSRVTMTAPTSTNSADHCLVNTSLSRCDQTRQSRVPAPCSGWRPGPMLQSGPLLVLYTVPLAPSSSPSGKLIQQSLMVGRHPSRSNILRRPLKAQSCLQRDRMTQPSNRRRTARFAPSAWCEEFFTVARTPCCTRACCVQRFRVVSLCETVDFPAVCLPMARCSVASETHTAVSDLKQTRVPPRRRRNRPILAGQGISHRSRSCPSLGPRHLEKTR